MEKKLCSPFSCIFVFVVLLTSSPEKKSLVDMFIKYNISIAHSHEIVIDLHLNNVLWVTLNSLQPRAGTIQSVSWLGSA